MKPTTPKTGRRILIAGSILLGLGVVAAIIARAPTRVDALTLPAGTVHIGQDMLRAQDILPTDIGLSTEDDPDCTIVTSVGTVPGMVYVYRYQLLHNGRFVAVRFSRRLPRRPFAIVSDNQPGAGGRHDKLYPFVVQQILQE